MKLKQPVYKNIELKKNRENISLSPQQPRPVVEDKPDELSKDFGTIKEKFQ